MTKSLAPIIVELEKAYCDIMDKIVKNSGSYASVPPMPIITVQHQKQRFDGKDVFGWYKPRQWYSESEDAVGILAGTLKAGEHSKQDEINITPDGLDRSKVEILTTLFHQAIHHWSNYNHRVTLNSNGYHNQWFKNKAQHEGLQVEYEGSHGWANTKPTKSLRDFLSGIDINEEVFDLIRKTERTKEYKGSKLKKWTCGCTNLRVATYLEAICIHCGKEFVYADKDAQNIDVLHWFDTKQKGHAIRYPDCKRKEFLS